MVIVYHIGAPRKVEKKVKVNVCDVKYVNSKGEVKTKETRCDKNGKPYAKGYRSTRADNEEQAISKMKRHVSNNQHTYREWKAQKDNENALSLVDVRRNFRKSNRSKGYLKRREKEKLRQRRDDAVFDDPDR